jgi:hypothetical protein
MYEVIERPIIIVRNGGFYFLFDQNVTWYNWLEDLIEYLQTIACSQGHLEPVIHAEKIYLLHSDQMRLLEGNFYLGIPLQEVIDAMHEFFKN